MVCFISKSDLVRIRLLLVRNKCEQKLRRSMHLESLLLCNLPKRFLNPLPHTQLIVNSKESQSLNLTKYQKHEVIRVFQLRSLNTWIRFRTKISYSWQLAKNSSLRECFKNTPLYLDYFLYHLLYTDEGNHLEIYSM